MVLKITNISGISFNNKTLNNARYEEQSNHCRQVSNSINLNNAPVGVMNKNLLSFKGENYKDYSYLFLNFENVYNSETEVLPKTYYTGYVDKDIYFSAASASMPLNQENLWTLFSPVVFAEFLNKNPDLAEILCKYDSLALLLEDEFALQDVRSVLRDKNNNGWLQPIFDFAKAFEAKFDIDILKDPKYYRFIGKSELVKLLKGEEIEKLPPYYEKVFDITTNPELNWNQFRVTFKNNKTFTNIDETHSMDGMVIEHDRRNYRYYLKSSYSLNDIDKLEMATPHGLLEFDLNHKYTDEELNKIDTLMFCN